VSQTSCLAVAFLSAVALAKEEAKAGPVCGVHGRQECLPHLVDCDLHHVTAGRKVSQLSNFRTLEL
jgi:hypothetical protein